MYSERTIREMGGGEVGRERWNLGYRTPENPPPPPAAPVPAPGPRTDGIGDGVSGWIYR